MVSRCSKYMVCDYIDYKNIIISISKYTTLSGESFAKTKLIG